MSKTGMRATVAGQVDIIKICKDINIKYLKKEQINKSLMKDFVFKAKFGHKIGNLKLNGSKLEVMRKLEEWI